jgi:hypothetical protein
MVGYFMTPIFPNYFAYKNIKVNDSNNENILIYLVKGIKFIEESKIGYVHCQLGKSRSASIAMAYVMYKNKIHFAEAFDFVKDKRYIVYPNESFQWQLEDFDIILTHFNYDLDKCDEFIRNFFENRERLRESEKDFLEKKLKKQLKYVFDDKGDKNESILEEEKLEE